jgi:hypothetical protein
LTVRASSGDTDVDDGLALTLSASDALAMVGLEAAKSAIRVVLNVVKVDFTLYPVFPQLFVVTFRSKELRDRASKVSVPSGPLG